MKQLFTGYSVSEIILFIIILAIAIKNLVQFVDWSKKRAKQAIDENEKPSISNLIRKAKKILFTSLLKYDNYIISKVYNNKLGNVINIKKLFKINHFQIKNLTQCHKPPVPCNTYNQIRNPRPPQKREYPDFSSILFLHPLYCIQKD